MTITSCYRIVPINVPEPIVAPKEPFDERFRIIGDSRTDVVADIMLSGVLPLVGSVHSNPDWPFTVVGVNVVRQSRETSIWLGTVSYLPTAWLPPPEAVWTHSREYRTDTLLEKPTPVGETH